MFLCYLFLCLVMFIISGGEIIEFLLEPAITSQKITISYGALAFILGIVLAIIDSFTVLKGLSFDKLVNLFN